MNTKYSGSDDIFRLYVREWVIVHTVHSPVCEEDIREAVGRWIAGNLTERVRDADIRTEEITGEHGLQWVHIKVYRENLKGEYKSFGAAQLTASIKDYEEYTIVPRNSPADHEIRNYGVTKL